MHFLCYFYDYLINLSVISSFTNAYTIRYAAITHTAHLYIYIYINSLHTHYTCTYMHTCIHSFVPIHTIILVCTDVTTCLICTHTHTYSVDPTPNIIHVHPHTHTPTHLNTPTATPTHTLTHIPTHTLTYLHLQCRPYTQHHTHTHIPIYTYTYTRLHTHPHTRSIYNRNESNLDLDNLYYLMRETVSKCELYVLRVLKFTVSYTHPHKVVSPIPIMLLALSP